MSDSMKVLDRTSWNASQNEAFEKRLPKKQVKKKRTFVTVVLPGQNVLLFCEAYSQIQVILEVRFAGYTGY